MTRCGRCTRKKLRYWFVKDGKRKRTPKISPAVPVPKVSTPKIVVKGTCSSQPKFYKQGVDLLKDSLENFIKKNDEVTAQKEQSASVPAEGVKEKEPECAVHDDSSDVDDESMETDSEIERIGVGKVTLKKKAQKKKKKGSDDEDSTYTPTAIEKNKLWIKRKAVQIGIIPRNVRAKKGGASMTESQSGKSEKHVATSKGHEAEKVQSIEVFEVPEVQSVEKPEDQKNAGDDEVDIIEVRVSTPPPPPPPPESQPIPKEAESSKPKKTVLPDPFEGFPNIRGELKDDILLDDEFDMFHDASVKDLKKKMSLLEKEKEKAEAERDELKKQLEELTKVNEEIKSVLIKQAKKMKKMEGDVDDNAKLFELLSKEISDLHVKNVKLNDINKTLNQLISELHEASTNEFKAMKLEMEALRADKVVKDEQLNMLYTVMEHHLGIDVQSIYKNIKIKRVEERMIEREKRLAKEATQRKKDVIIRTQEAGGSSSQADVEMVDVEVDQAQGFVLKVEEEEEKEDEDLDDVLDAVDNYDRSWDDLIDKDDDEDQGSTGLLIVNPSIQQKIEDFMNDEINEQEEDHQQESSSSRKKHADQVFLTQPTVIYLNARVEGEIEVPRSRAEMLEELGLNNGKFKFDIEYEIPSSPEKEYQFMYAQEADKYNDALVEEGSDSSDEETVFHYAGNEDEVRRKIVDKITTEGVPKTIPRENPIEERKKWFKVKPNERKFIRPLQYFTHDANISWGDILSWGYLEDLQVYAIRREQGVQYFEFLSEIKTLPWWDIEELVQTKNIKQLYYSLDVKQHDKHLWDYIKQQAKARFPDWKPQYPKQIVTILESREKDITLDIKPPRCLKNMPLRAMEQDFHKDFQGWLYNQSTTEAVISLFDKSAGASRRISVLDPMWLVNCSKKDIDCLFYNKIVYEKPNKVQAIQYQKIVDVCFAKDISFGRYWKSKWRDLEIDELLKKYNRSQRLKEIAEKAARLGRYKLMRPPPTDRTPIEKEENKIPRWDRKRDGDPEYRKYWNEVGRPLRRKMLEER
ncbi:hypothetical protein Hanom_Chr08g00735811 [Helianthus anomalus]